MLVKNWMSKKVITIDVKDSMQDAMRLLKENDIRMLPVMKKGELAGIITDRDLKRASASDATNGCLSQSGKSFKDKDKGNHDEKPCHSSI